MQHSQGLSFLPNPISLVLGTLMVTVTVALCWLAWRRSGYRRATGLLELLRLALVCLVVGTLCQPEWLALEPATQKSTLAVLWDQSNSMQTRDVVDPAGHGAEAQSRAEAVAPLLTEEIWKQTEGGSSQGLEVVFEPFSSRMDPAAEATDLNHGLSQVLDSYANLRGVVLLSDGDWNVGPHRLPLPQVFACRGCPCSPWP